MINSHQPDVLILTETRVSEERANSIIASLGYERYTKVDSMSFAGGIWVLWNPNSVPLEPIASSFQEIHLECKVTNFSFLLTAIYASPIFERRKLLWSSFTNLTTILSKPWLIIGDFNDIAKLSEQKMSVFNNFLTNYGLVDLGFLGSPFTWTNGRIGNQIVRTQIDRAHANCEWLSHFLDIKVIHLPKPRLDHNPLLLKTQNFNHLGSKPFWF